jgi:membrane fusion protein, peptide pheromone/bacteriocin exporter
MDLIPFSISEFSLETYLIKVSIRSRIIYWIIILTVISLIALLPFIYVDVSVQARGYFQADIEKQIIFAPLQGKVAYSSIHNGSPVRKGDTLLIIDKEASLARRTSLIQSMNENNASINDLEKLTGMSYKEYGISIEGLVSRRYSAEAANFRNQYLTQLQKFMKKKTEHDRNEVLFQQQIIARTEYENSLFSLNSEKNNLIQIQVSQKSIWQNDLTLRKNDSVKLKSDLQQVTEELNDRVILAPTDGEIIQSADIQTGSMVSSGQKLVEISPEGNLVATCFVKPGDIGFIHEKQSVRIQVDAFNHNEWGTLDGQIIDISDDMIVENGSVASFRIKCKPQKTYLTLKNGYKAQIRKGMSLSTRIFVIRRSLLHLLFDKVDKWFNPYMNVKQQQS